MSSRPNVQKLRTSTVLAAACAVLLAGNAFAGDPSVIQTPWRLPDLPDLQAKPSGESRGVLTGEQGEQTKGALLALGKASQVADAARQALDFSKTLNASDDRLKPNYTPEGVPSIPSKCMENAECQPCYGDAYGKINKTRTALEKVRAHYDFTHKFSSQGIAFMNAVAATAGGPAGIGAAVETQKVNDSVKAFNTVVRNKNAELLARLKGELMEVNTCESKYYGNTDWYDRFGYMYFQFMTAHYGYAVAHSR